MLHWVFQSLVSVVGRRVDHRPLQVSPSDAVRVSFNETPRLAFACLLIGPLALLLACRRQASAGRAA